MIDGNQLERIIASWKNQFGEEYKDKIYVPLNSRKRTDMYKHLIKTLIDKHEASQEDLEGIIKSIYDTSTNETSKNLNTWKKLIKIDWLAAIDCFFPQEILFHDSSNDPEPTHRTKSEDNAKCEPNEPYYVPVEPESADLINVPLLDRSIFKGLPPVKDIPDEDFLKILENAEKGIYE